jgi:hypothetical protein
MVIIGLWVRLKLVESETFTTAEKKGAIRRFPWVRSSADTGRT